MELIDAYNGLGAEINKMTIEQLQGFSGVDFNNLDKIKLEDEVFKLYDKFIYKLEKGSDKEKIEAKYTLCFLILLFSYNNQSDDGDRE